MNGSSARHFEQRSRVSQVKLAAHSYSVRHPKLPLSFCLCKHRHLLTRRHHGKIRARTTVRCCSGVLPAGRGPGCTASISTYPQHPHAGRQRRRRRRATVACTASSRCTLSLSPQSESKRHQTRTGVEQHALLTCFTVRLALDTYNMLTGLPHGVWAFDNATWPYAQFGYYGGECACMPCCLLCSAAVIRCALTARVPYLRLHCHRPLQQRPRCAAVSVALHM